MSPLSPQELAQPKTPALPLPEKPLAQQTAEESLAKQTAEEKRAKQAAEEHRAFCNRCIDFYTHKYAVIISDAARRNSFHQGVESAERYLQETFTRSSEADGNIDRNILNEIRSAVFRKREEVLIDLTIAFSG